MKALKLLRKSKGWSQATLAEVAVVDQSTISKLENGWDGATLKIIKQISEALNVRPYELLLDDTTAAELNLISIYRSLPEDRKRGWLDMAALAKADSQAKDQ